MNDHEISAHQDHITSHIVGDFINLVDEKGTFFSALNGRDDFNSDSESNI